MNMFAPLVELTHLTDLQLSLLEIDYIAPITPKLANTPITSVRTFRLFYPRIDGDSDPLTFTRNLATLFPGLRELYIHHSPVLHNYVIYNEQTG